MTVRRSRSLGLFVLIGLVAFRSPAQEWSRFRGPNGSGVSLDTILPARWTDRDYQWRTALPGIGHSSPILWSDRVFLTAGDETSGRRFVLGIHAGDGRRLWTREFDAERHGKHALNSFATATPAADARHVYVSWATPRAYVVLALDHDGRDVWRADLGPFQVGYGIGASPVVHDDLVIVPNEQDRTSELVALDAATGKVRWRVARRSKATYITPCVYRPKQRPAELIFTSWEHGVTGIDPATGRTNWELDIFAKGHIETGIASPIVAGDLVIATCGWMGVRKEVIAVRPPLRSGDASPPRPLYCIDRSAPLCTTPLVTGGLLLLWSDDGIVTGADAATGEVHWRERVAGTFYGSPVAAAGHVYCMSAEGDIVVLAASRQFRLVHRQSLGEGSHSTPAIGGGRLFLRTFTQLLAIGGTRR